MSASNIFASLAAGTKFRGKQNQEAREVFTGKKLQEQRKGVDLLDWLGVQNGKRKADDEDSHADNDDGDDDSDDEDANSSDEDSSSSLKKTPQLLQRDDEINAFRNRLRIKVTGDKVAAPVPTFTAMNGISNSLKAALIRNIEESQWKDPTAIQMQAIPCLLEGRDVLASAPTGSGKTAAFVIPALSLLHSQQQQQQQQQQQVVNSKKSKKGNQMPSTLENNIGGIKVLLLAPTRELAEQIHREAMRLSQNSSRKLKICLLTKKLSSNVLAKQDSSWSRKQDLLVATPLRLLSLIRARNVIDLSRVKLIVLDEADRLFELQGRDSIQQQQEDSDDGDDNNSNNSNNNDKEEELSAANKERIRTSFLSQVDEILAECPTGRNAVQRALFSATVGPFVQELADGFLSNYVHIRIGSDNAGAETINQRLMCVGREDGKLLAIRQLIQEGLKPPVLIFLQSIQRAKELFKELIFDGINVDVMHAERSNAQREEIIKRFRTGDIWVLICTDLMARGIDFKGVNMVINYDLPQSAVAYIHRIGRTGRAGRSGEAVTFFTEHDLPNIRAIANVVRASGCQVPEWMLSIKPLNTKQKKQLRRSAPKRRKISTDALPERPAASAAAAGKREHKKKSKKSKKRRSNN